MTTHGCDDRCPTCAGLTCTACQVADPLLPIAMNCPHDPVERHHGMQPLVIAESRVPTKPLPPIELGGSIVIEVDDDNRGEALAQFFESLARVLRARGRAKITVE